MKKEISEWKNEKKEITYKYEKRDIWMKKLIEGANYMCSDVQDKKKGKYNVQR